MTYTEARERFGLRDGDTIDHKGVRDVMTDTIALLATASADDKEDLYLDLEALVMLDKEDWRVGFVFEKEQDAKFHEVEFTDRDKRTAYIVLNSMVTDMSESEITNLLGSEGSKRMKELHKKLDDEWRFGAYCKAKGIQIDEMTDEDYENIATDDRWM